MSELILHHYPASPFAEKVRLMLGYKKLAMEVGAHPHGHAQAGFDGLDRRLPQDAGAANWR